MKILAFLALTVLSFNAVADNYKLQLTRKETNLYRIDNMSSLNNEWFLVTSLCLEFALGDTFLVSYTPYSFSNKIFFSSRTTCDLKEVRNVITYR